MESRDTILTLTGLAGPPMEPVELSGDATATIGRLIGSEVCLLDDRVSRRHATLTRKRGTWYILDVGSTSGTFVNGVRLPKGVPAPLSSGDVLRIGPWAIRAGIGVGGAPSASGEIAVTRDDAGEAGRRVESASRLGVGLAVGLEDRRLRLLTDLITRLGAAADEDAGARALLHVVLTTSGYSRGAVLRRTEDGREVEVVASERWAGPQGSGNSAPAMSAPSSTSPTPPAPAKPPGTPQEAMEFSRTLIERANSGESAILSDETGPIAPGAQGPQSIVGAGIHSALCVPLQVGGSVVGYLYLDARGNEARVRRDSTGFCEAAATAYALSIANVRRGALERAQRELHAELNAAREVQRMVQPVPRGRVACCEYALECRPGLFVAGDLVDLVDLGDGRAAVCVGDVAGHGMSAALLMAALQSHLRALLAYPGIDVPSAIMGLNRYLAATPLEGRFASLWLGVIEPSGELTYTDAGHGHWMIVGKDGQPKQSALAAGIPIGIDGEAEFPIGRTALGPGERLILYSDGLIEQPGASGEQFGMQQFRAALLDAPSPYAAVMSTFGALTRHVGSTTLDDDATVVVVEVA